MDTDMDIDKDLDMDMDLDMDITLSLSHQEANFEIGFWSLFRHCVLLKLPSSPSLIA
jgi:hypothetical protein